jgi:hypothetical protein
MMNEPNDSTSENVPSHNERRLLIVVLCLSYLACLAGLWLIGNFPGQAHAVLPGIFGLGQNTRFALLAVPLVGLCASYFRLRHLTGKIITMLCLAILAYICVHSMLLSATPPATTGGATNALISAFPRPVISELPSKIARAFTEVTPQKISLQNGIVHWWIVKPELRNTPAAPSPSIDLVNLGLYYGLFLVTMVLIVKTLPTAVIGWKERG